MLKLSGSAHRRIRGSDSRLTKRILIRSMAEVHVPVCVPDRKRIHPHRTGGLSPFLFLSQCRPPRRSKRRTLPEIRHAH